MKKIVLIIVLVVVLLATTIILTGCTLKLEAEDSSVSASVDGDTTEKIDNILDWIKDRLGRVFNTSDSNTSTTVKTNI